ncbi:MAG: hypothetical protein IT337_03030 [Thermomicrobiales bacterium]|nr:hypothetical protein [Thermomicrobiales bacterium]
MTTNHDLAALATRLASASRRARIGLAIDAAVMGGASGAGLWVFFEAIRRILPEGFGRMMDAVGLGGIAEPLRQSVVAALVVAVVVAVCVFLATLSGAPGETLLARRADRRFGLRERLSTALEVAGTPSGPIEAALLRDAEADAGRIDVRRLAPLHLPKALWLLALLLATGLVLQLAPVTETAPPAPRAAGFATLPPLPETLTVAERAAVAEEIHRAAEAIRTAAEAAGDPVVAGVGRTLERLGQDIAAGENIDRDAITEELGALLDYAGATPTAPPADALVAAETAAAALQNILAAVQQNGNGATPQLTTGEGRDTGNEVEPVLDEDHAVPMVVGRTAERGIGDGTRQAPADRMQGNIGGIQMQLPNEWEDDDVINEARAGGTARPNAAAGNLGVETAAQPGQQRTAPGPGLGDDMPPNGGTQRTELAGEAPGAGVQAEGNRPIIAAEPLEYEIDHGMDLDGAVNPQGRRIQIDIPPAPEVENATDTAPEAAAEWRLTPEAAIARLLLDPTARDLVARYFGALAPIPEAP